MFTGAKPELTEYRKRLEEWRRDVPERAGRFHRQADTLSREIEDQLKKWWPWLGGAERQQLRHRVDRLNSVAGRLRDMIHEAVRLAENVERLEGRAQDVGPALEDWLLRNCREWKVELDDLGKRTDRSNELTQEERTLENVRTALQAHEQAVQLLKKAGEVRRELERLEGMEVAEFESRLPELTGRLEMEGPTEPWMEDLRTFLRPFEKALEAITSPPQALQSVASILNELWAWAGHLDTLHEVKLLEERKGFYAVEWTRRDPSELDGLRTEAEELLARYVESARALRQERLDRLDEELQDFFAVCGHQPELSERFDRLRDSHRRLDRPQLHPRWLEDLDKESSRFKAIAENYQTELTEGLDKLATKLEQGLAELHEKPLSAEVKQKIRDLEYDTAQLRKLKSIEEILPGLRRGQEYERTLTALDRQSQREIQELAETQTQLVERQEQLTALARELSFVAEDHAEAIATLDAGSRPLEEARREADRLAELIAGEEGRFVEHCRGLVADHGQAVRETREILERAGRTVSREMPAEVPEGAPPHEAAEAVRNAVTLFDAVEEELEEELEAVSARSREKLRELETIPPDSLGLDDREDLAQVLEVLRDSVAAPSGASRERLALLLDLLEQCRIVSEQLKRDEIEAEQKLDSLRQRWQEFKSAHLKRYLPELGERVEALIHGLSQTPRSPRETSAQLRLAEELFGRLDRHARRLAARDLEDAVVRLRRQSAKAPDGAAKSRTAELLAAVERFDHRELPPPTLRMKIRGALRGARQGAPR